MGSRANYLITSQGQHAIFYSHWGAQYMDRDFFFGPEAAIRLVRSTAPVQELHPLPEGGAIIDCDHRRLRLWGGDDISWQPRLRAIWLQMLKFSWEGWDVDWTDEGVFALVRHLGLCPDPFLPDPVPVRVPKSDFELVALKPGDAGPRSLITLRRPDGTMHDVLARGTSEGLIIQGPRLLEQVAAVPSIPLPAETDWWQCCLYFDLDRRRLWLSPPQRWGYADPQWSEYIASCWPGWEVHLHNGGGVFHIQLSGRDPRPLLIPAAEHIKLLATIVTGSDVDPSHLLKLGLKGMPTDGSVIINPGFLQRHESPMPVSERLDHFLRVLSLWRQRYGDR